MPTMMRTTPAAITARSHSLESVAALRTLKMAKAALCMVVALAVASCAFAGRALNEQPVAAPANAPLPADPLPGPMEPLVDPVVVPVLAPAAATPLPTSAAGAAGVAQAAGVGVTGGATANVGAGVAAGAGDHPLTFFMRDIIGGSSQPSELMVTGVVASSADLANGNSVVPYDSLVQSNGDAINGGYKNIPSVNAGGDLPSAATPQNRLFGMTTVVDEELTKGHEVGSAAVGRAQGFYVASSQDGASKTVVLTAMFGGELHGDTLSFFGVHRMAAPEFHIAIIGGTGKYENAKGFAAIQSLHPGDQHITDGDQTLLQFDIHLS